MRNLIIRLPEGQGESGVRLARQHDVLDVSTWRASIEGQSVDIVSVQIRNESVESLLREVTKLKPLSITLDPHEILHFTPPLSEASEGLKELQQRSPVEIFLMGLQSVSSWRNFAIYAIAGAMIVWIAFYTNSIYLLIAAMLVSPFAGPAMNVAMATATGDARLFLENLYRYLAAIGFTMGLTALLTLIFNQRFITDLMATVGHISEVAILLPLVAGMAGSFNLIQSERSSLVSSTSVGMLVTASLAPPAGLLGIALVMQNWNLVMNTSFILILQLLGLNLSGSIVFRLFGLNTDILQYKRGKRAIFFVGLLITIIALSGLLIWQFTGSIRMQRISEETQITQAVLTTIEEEALARPIEVDARFTSTEAYGENTLIVTVYAQKAVGVDLTKDLLIRKIEISVLETIQSINTQITPFVNVVVFDPPPSTLIQ